MDFSIESTATGGKDLTWLASTHAIGTAQPGTLNLASLASAINQYGVIPAGVAVGKLANDQYGLFAGGASEVQTVTISGAPSGGTFTLSYGGEATAPIAYNAPAATVKAAVEALAGIGAGNTTVTGTGPYVITFGGALAGRNLQQLGSASAFTGGTTPAVAVTTTTPGASDGTGLLAGFILDDVKAWNSQNNVYASGKAAFALLPQGAIKRSRLPIVAQRTAITYQTPSTGQFVYAD